MLKVYFQSTGDTEWTDFAFVLITGIIAYHGISYRDVEGERELVHLFLAALHYFMESGF
tara:strand:+ start:932 stop:1108 length:177 start_codon:yes stop_codon:yes gene_type:complete